MVNPRASSGSDRVVGGDRVGEIRPAGIRAEIPLSERSGAAPAGARRAERRRALVGDAAAHPVREERATEVVEAVAPVVEVGAITVIAPPADAVARTASRVGHGRQARAD